MVYKFYNENLCAVRYTRLKIMFFTLGETDLFTLLGACRIAC